MTASSSLSLRPYHYLAHLLFYSHVLFSVTSHFFLLFQSELSHLDSKTARDIRNLPPISPPVRTFTSYTILMMHYLRIYYSCFHLYLLLFFFIRFILRGIHNFNFFSKINLAILHLKINLKSYSSYSLHSKSLRI
jgi:hypothetical protein